MSRTFSQTDFLQTNLSAWEQVGYGIAKGVFDRRGGITSSCVCWHEEPLAHSAFLIIFIFFLLILLNGNKYPEVVLISVTACDRDSQENALHFLWVIMALFPLHLALKRDQTAWKLVWFPGGERKAG
ncbi:hypothetical protein [Reticulibacter mediterranei]|uniref:hypothetical protein n=1 Tax=Reticulibacter mediterranei TaxID=2778369 RepID=UPI001C691C65|nr:hypothetical protein [Reticulibacter mediterranei]